MEQNLKDRLSSFKEVLKQYKEFGINPINSQIEDMKRLYADIGHQPIGNCGGCFPRMFEVLFDHLIEEKLI